MIDFDGLDRKAIEAAENSYSPYSNFKVGAALVTASGEIVVGTNVENASYGLTICAERCAMFSARAQGYKDKFLALSVVCPDGNKDEPDTLMPCGACRQVLVEMLADDATISVVGVGHFSKEDLLPKSFKL